MKVRFITPASFELGEAVKYYDHQLPGLGYRFYQEAATTIERIVLMPEAWTKVGDQTRRCILKGFPTAVAHLHRDPKRYQDRIE